MDIEGLGEKMSYTLFREGLVKDIAQVYDLTPEAFWQRCAASATLPPAALSAWRMISAS